jgi:hypothetical protein
MARQTAAAMQKDDCGAPPLARRANEIAVEHRRRLAGSIVVKRREMHVLLRCCDGAPDQEQDRGNEDTGDVRHRRC